MYTILRTVSKHIKLVRFFYVYSFRTQINTRRPTMNNDCFFSFCAVHNIQASQTTQTLWCWRFRSMLEQMRAEKIGRNDNRKMKKNTTSAPTHSNKVHTRINIHKKAKQLNGANSNDWKTGGKNFVQCKTEKNSCS